MSIQSSLAAFLSDYPDYDHHSVEQLRKDEYQRIDDCGHAYLDYTGGGLHSKSQLQKHFEVLSSEVAGNPHSRNPTSAAMTKRVEQARSAVLDYFNADPEEYLAIFTANASGALKLIGESYPFTADSKLLLSFDNHNSVNGIREFARAKGASVEYAPIHRDDLRIHRPVLEAQLSALRPQGNHLFGYCAQSNFSGVKHSMDWIEHAQDQGWDVLLDAAAFVPTNALDLSLHHPQFAVLSFYKMFGYPTGLGCLLIRRDAAKKLCRPWFAGGTVSVASVQGGQHFLADDEASFEDGTVNYLDIPAVEIGIDHIKHIGMDTIHHRVKALTGWLLNQLSSLRHRNGQPMIEIFGPLDTENRGATIALAVLDPAGKPHDERQIEMLAGLEGISVRTGCFCNPGAGEIAHDLSHQEMQALFETGERVTFDKLRDTIERDYHKSVSSIRVSMGIASNFSDVHRLICFLQELADISTEEMAPYQPAEKEQLRNLS